MKNLKTLCVAALAVLVFNVHAQSYNFSVSTDTYTDLTDATSVNDGMTWDDPSFEIPIGFDFKLFSKLMDKISVVPMNGSGSVLSVDTHSMGIVPVIMCYFSDLVDWGYIFDTPNSSSLSPISYKLSGSPGNRVFKIEWKNAGFYSEINDDNISSDYVNFQIWFYEGSNDIEFHYGPNSITYPELSLGEVGVRVGLFPEFDRGGIGAVAEGIVLTGEPNNPNVQTGSNIGFSKAIPNGTIYKFAYQVSSVPSLDDSKLNIYPNPVEDVLSFDVNGENFNNYKFSVIDILGNSIIELTKSKKIDVTDLKSGVYFIKMQNAEGYSMHRFIKK